MDMRFVNNTDAPIYIEGGCYGGQITFVIYGHETRPENRTIEFESRTIQTMDSGGYSLYPDATQPVGYIVQTQSPHTGCQAQLWKHIYVDGIETDEVLVNESYYQSVGTVYSVGVMTPNAAVQQALYAAIGSNNLEAVQQIIKTGSAAPAQPDTNQNPAQNQNTAGDIDDNYVAADVVTIVN